MTQKKDAPKRKRTQQERLAETRAKLLDAAFELFSKHGYAETGTPEIVRKAGVTRGALYHQFDSKRDLFHALAIRESEAVAASIVASTEGLDDPDRALLVGTEAYFDAMSVPGRARLLLAEAPGVLGYFITRELTHLQGGEALHEGLQYALPELDPELLSALANAVSAAFDRSALAIAEGQSRDSYSEAMRLLVKLLTKSN